MKPPSTRLADSAGAALKCLGMSPVRPLVSLATAPGRPQRQAVRATVHSRHHLGHLCGRHSGEGLLDVAVRVLFDPDAAAAERFAWEHRVGRVLGGIASGLVRRGVIHRNPLPGVLHPAPIAAGEALVSVSRFVPESPAPVTAGVWGETLGLLHVIGSTPEAMDLLATRPVANTLAGLDADKFLQALDRPGHPLRKRTDLVLSFARVLRERALRAVRLDPEPVLAHRDLHALNCVNAPGGGVAIDWQEAGWGSRSDDFAWTHVLVSRFGGSRRILDAARRAYARASHGRCPTDEQITAAGQVRELLCLGFSIQNAYISPDHLAEFLVELPVLDDPDARTGTWRALFNPAIVDPGLVP